MHGRLKVRTTAEEDERKKKERAKKVAAYRAAINKVFLKRENGELDEEGLQLAGQLLSANPDIYTMWNFRKEVLIHMKETMDEEKLKQLIDTELYLTEVCLRSNPKSYGTWHHRCWVLNKMVSFSWKKEVDVCSKYLDLDERNFHVWDYRRFVVTKAEVEPAAELEYTTEKINNNFSNYSAWHYRSKLLPIVHPDPHTIRPVEESIHKKELVMVESAAFTDPYDQSAWFYLRWLLGRVKPDLSICQASVIDDTIILHFNRHVSLDVIKIKSSMITSNWETVNNERFSFVFVNKCDVNYFAGDQELEISVYSTNDDSLIDSIRLNKHSNNTAIFNKPLHFEEKFSPGLTAVLKQQLQSCTELLNFEPDSKWALLTSVYLMQAIDKNEYKQKTMSLLGQLMEVDQQRSAYYSDLRSRYQIEYLLEDKGTSFVNSELIVSGCQLTALYHTEYLMTVQVLDLSNNSITNRSLPLLRYLQFCKVLKLNGNKISSLKQFPTLLCLENLNCSSNEICSKDGFDETINNCKKLICVDLSNNPIVNCDDIEETCKAFKDLKIILQ